MVVMLDINEIFYPTYLYSNKHYLKNCEEYMETHKLFFPLSKKDSAIALRITNYSICE